MNHKNSTPTTKKTFIIRIKPIFFNIEGSDRNKLACFGSDFKCDKTTN